MDFIKSPLNYTGGKYKLLPQLLEIFPKEIDTFVDLFAGGGNVAVNVNAKHIIYNDIMWQVPEMLQEFKRVGVEECLQRIDYFIEAYELSKDNREGYLKLRECYNNSFDLEFLLTDPLMLYTLICYSFNNQIRFNSKHEYNMPFGYCDPPYLITVASYNENGGWGEQAERESCYLSWMRLIRQGYGLGFLMFWRVGEKKIQF